MKGFMIWVIIVASIVLFMAFVVTPFIRSTSVTRHEIWEFFNDCPAEWRLETAPWDDKAIILVCRE